MAALSSGIELWQEKRMSKMEDGFLETITVEGDERNRFLFCL